MPIHRNSATQQEKFIAFQRAYRSILLYQESENFIAAYVLAFSVLEDRIKAMYVVGFLDKQQRPPKQDQIDQGFLKLTSKLKHINYISLDFYNKLYDEALKRNELLHSTLWNADAFTSEAVNSLLVLVKESDRLLKKKKREISFQTKSFPENYDDSTCKP